MDTYLRSIVSYRLYTTIIYIYICVYVSENIKLTFSLVSPFKVVNT